MHLTIGNARWRFLACQNNLPNSAPWDVNVNVDVDVDADACGIDFHTCTATRAVVNNPSTVNARTAQRMN